jgi:hypothetical protein
MARKVILDLDFSELDAALAPTIKEKCEIIKENAGPEYGYDFNIEEWAYPGKRDAPRTHGLVYTGTYKAIADNARHNTLLKAAGG